MPLEYKILPIFDFSTTRKQDLKIDKVSYTHTQSRNGYVQSVRMS